MRSEDGGGGMDSKQSVAGRAAIGVGLLVGFYALVAVVIAGTIAVNVAVFRLGGRPPTYLVLASALVVLGLLRSVLSLERNQHDEEDGIAVSRDEEPGLWALVDETAAAVGTRAPDDIVLVDDVNASVMELGGFLGLRRGRRQLRVGLGLLSALDVGQTRAVLAHEMGHYSGGDTRLGPVNYRGGASIGRAVHHLGSGTLLGRLFAAYAAVYWRITLAVRRRQELSADATAAALAGADAFSSSLRAVATAGPAYGFLLERYAGPVWQRGAHPADLYAGFRALLADPRRQEQLAGVLADAEQGSADPYDSHPTLSERLTAVAGACDGASARDDAQAPSGRTLLRDPEATERAMSRSLAVRALGAEPGPAYEWDDIATAVHGVDQRSAAHATMAALGALDGAGVPTLRQFLDALDSDAVLPLAVALTGDVSAVPAEQRTELQAAVMKQRTLTVLTTALVDQGKGTWRLSWSGPLEAVTPEGQVVDLSAAVEAALDDGAMAALRERIYELGIDERWKPAPPPERAAGGSELLAVVNDVHRAGRRCDLVVYADRFAVVTCRLPVLDRITVALAGAMGGSARGSAPFQRRCADLARTPVAELLTRDRRNRAASWSEVAEARLTRRLGGWRLRLVLDDGEPLDIKSLGSAPPRRAVEPLLRERLAAAGVALA